MYRLRRICAYLKHAQTYQELVEMEPELEPKRIPEPKRKRKRKVVRPTEKETPPAPFYDRGEI
jgi:hypothetical protein